MLQDLSLNCCSNLLQKEKKKTALYSCLVTDLECIVEHLILLDIQNYNKIVICSQEY